MNVFSTGLWGLVLMLVYIHFKKEQKQETSKSANLYSIYN